MISAFLWALRELAASGAPGREDDVAVFLVTHAALVSREGLRYATEKMPPTLRSRLLAESGKRPPAAAAVSGAAERGQRRKRGRGD